MNVKYRVTLETSERAQLVAMVLGGKGAFRRLKRAQILLAADNGATDEEIARTSPSVRRRSIEPSSASSKRGWNAR